MDNNEEAASGPATTTSPPNSGAHQDQPGLGPRSKKCSPVWSESPASGWEPFYPCYPAHLTRLGLNPAQQLYALVLLAHDGPKGCFPSEDTIARCRGLKHARNVSRDLKQIPFLKIIPGRRGRGQSNHYDLQALYEAMGKDHEATCSPRLALTTVLPDAAQKAPPGPVDASAALLGGILPASKEKLTTGQAIELVKAGEVTDEVVEVMLSSIRAALGGSRGKQGQKRSEDGLAPTFAMDVMKAAGIDPYEYWDDKKERNAAFADVYRVAARVLLTPQEPRPWKWRADHIEDCMPAVVAAYEAHLLWLRPQSGPLTGVVASKKGRAVDPGAWISIRLADGRYLGYLLKPRSGSPEAMAMTEGLKDGDRITITIDNEQIVAVQRIAD